MFLTSAGAVQWLPRAPSYCLLITLACLLGIEIKSLIIGEAPSRNYRKDIEQIVVAAIPDSRILNFLALQLGDQDVMVSLKILPGEIKEVSRLIEAINQVESQIKKRFPEIKWKFVEPDHSP